MAGEKPSSSPTARKRVPDTVAITAPSIPSSVGELPSGSPLKKPRRTTGSQRSRPYPRLFYQNRGTRHLLSSKFVSHLSTSTSSSSIHTDSTHTGTSFTSTSDPSRLPSETISNTSQDFQGKPLTGNPMSEKKPSGSESSSTWTHGPSAGTGARGARRIVPPPGRQLRRHETTLWMGEIISRGVDEDI